MTSPSREPSHGSPGNRATLLDPDTYYVCQRCTACCKWPGDVRIEEDEIDVAGVRTSAAKALADAEVQEKLTAQGLTVRGTTAEELGVATRAQLARYAQLFKSANIKPD